jgi:hypothetical protein
LPGTAWTAGGVLMPDSGEVRSGHGCCLGWAWRAWERVSGWVGLRFGPTGLRPEKLQRTGRKDEGASADFGTWAATICGPKKERRKEIPFYFQKAFSWKTK